MRQIRDRIEARTGLHFGILPKRKRLADPDPVIAAGFLVESCGGVDYRSGIYIDVGGRGIYVARMRAIERGLARDITRIERHANS